MSTSVSQHLDKVEERGRAAWEALPADLREDHQIDRSRLSKGAQCVCTCGTACPDWPTHLRAVGEHRELWNALEAQRAQFVGSCCEHEYRRHLIGLDGCADCERWEPEHA